MTLKQATMVFVGSMALVLAASPRATAQRWGFEPLPRDGACFYQDANYRGEYFCIRTDEDLVAVPRDMNDRISSIRILGRTEVTVFRDVRFAGRAVRFDRDIRDLGDEGWNDLISSIRVRNASRNDRDREYGRAPVGPPRVDPDRIIQRAYQDILEREPDTAGLRTYRSRMIDDGWSEAQVRDALRNSQEYREKNTMTMAKAQDIVRRAYLAVLGREPDSGSRGYVDNVLRDHWTQQDVERELRKSAEYLNRRR